MAGLLDLLGSDTGLLGLQLMAAGSAKPVKTGFGEGLLGALQNVQAQRAAEEEKRQKKAMQDMEMKLIGAQVDETRAQALQRQAAAAKQANLMKMLTGIVDAPDSQSQYGAAGGGLNLGGVKEPMVPQRGGLAGATPEQLAMLKVNGIDLADLAKQARTGDKMDSGAYYRQPNGQMRYMMDPTKGLTTDGNSVSVAPGAAESLGALAGSTKEAEARATGRYDLVSGFVGDKPGYVGTRTSIADQFNAPREQPRYAPPPTDPRQVDARLVDAATVDLQDWTNGLRNKRGAQAPTQRGPFVQTGPGTQERASAEAVGLGNQSFMKDRYAPALEAGDAATQTIAATQAARTALANLGNSGWGTPVIAGAASVLGALGVPQAEKFAGNAQMFQSAAMGRLWTTLNSAKGPQTEGDADRASKTFAKLENTPAANQFILDMTHATAERERLRAQYFREALPMAQKSGDLQEIERRWSRISPSVFSLPMMKRWAQ